MRHRCDRAVVDVAQVGGTPALDLLLRQLQERVLLELRTQDALQRLTGTLEPIIASAAASGLVNARD